MRVSPAEYLSLRLRAHELLHDVPVYDVSVVNLPGGGPDRTLADIWRLESRAPPSRIAKVLFGLRRYLGDVFGWDRDQMRPEHSLVSKLSDQDRRDSEIPPGTVRSGFRVVYQFPREMLSEIRNATVQGYLSIALIPIATGYRLYWAVYVVPVSWLTRPYLMAIEPFRRFLLYPAMLRRLRRAWTAQVSSRPFC
jgi:hypothetical protein